MAFGGKSWPVEAEAMNLGPASSGSPARPWDHFPQERLFCLPFRTRRGWLR